MSCQVIPLPCAGLPAGAAPALPRRPFVAAGCHGPGRAWGGGARVPRSGRWLVETENHDQPAGVAGEYVIRCGAAFLRRPLCRAHSQIVPKCGFVLGPRSLQEAPSRRQAVEAGRPQGTARARSRCGGAERNSRKREAAMAGSFLKVRDAPPCGYSGCSSRECTIPGGVVPAEWLRHAGLLVLKLPALPRPA